VPFHVSPHTHHSHRVALPTMYSTTSAFAVLTLVINSTLIATAMLHPKKICRRLASP